MDRHGSAPLNAIAFGWAISAALLVLFVLCLLAALLLPGWTASHAWVGLYSTAPTNSFRVWIDGVVFSLVFGWIFALVVAFVYNCLIIR